MTIPERIEYNLRQELARLLAEIEQLREQNKTVKNLQWKIASLEETIEELNEEIKLRKTFSIREYQVGPKSLPLEHIQWLSELQENIIYIVYHYKYEDYSGIGKAIVKTLSGDFYWFDFNHHSGYVGLEPHKDNLSKIFNKINLSQIVASDDINDPDFPSKIVDKIRELEKSK